MYPNKNAVILSEYATWVRVYVECSESLRTRGIKTIFWVRNGLLVQFVAKIDR